MVASGRFGHATTEPSANVQPLLEFARQRQRATKSTVQWKLVELAKHSGINPNGGGISNEQSPFSHVTLDLLIFNLF